MVALLPDDTELLGGLELGGVPIATMVSSLTGRPALFVRKKAKEYGTCKLAEGPDVAGRRVTLIEDVITTGGAVRDATRALREAGAIVEVVVCAIDRSPAGENPLADVGLEVRPVLTKAQLDAVPASRPAVRRRAARRLEARDVGSGGRRRRRRRLGADVAVPPPLVGDRDHREGQDHEDRLVDVLAEARGTPRRGSSRAAGC